MKKLFSMLLAVAMMLSLCLCFAACGNLVPEQILPSEEPEISMGSYSGNTYRNDFLGLSCTVPEGWEFYSEEQLLELNGFVGEYVSEEVQEQLKNANVVFDMFAQHPTEGSSINVNMEKLNAVQLISLDIQETLEAQIPGIESSYQEMGYTDVQVNSQKATIDGKEFDSLFVSAKVNGMDFVLVCFAFRKGNYLVNVSAGTLQMEKLNSLLGCFTLQ